MIGRHHVIEDLQSIPFPGLIQPLQIAMPIPREFEQELPLVASVGNVPDVSRNEMSLCSGHKLQGNKAPFALKNVDIGPF